MKQGREEQCLGSGKYCRNETTLFSIDTTKNLLHYEEQHAFKWWDHTFVLFFEGIEEASNSHREAPTQSEFRAPFENRI